MKNNISNINNCYGCGVCATVCPKNIIAIKLNTYGFYEPQIIDKKGCINCRLCIEVCAYKQEKNSLQKNIIGSYAAWSKEKAIQRKCSSGGVGFEIGRYLLQKGYKVCGVKYNTTKNRAEHYIANSVDELIPSIGSKYIQSYTVDGFKEVNRKVHHLITGTPCQIDSFRRYIRKFKCEDKFILMDFFCHGVPSMIIWDEYTKEIEKKIGKITYASWRNKLTGWHDSWAMSIDGEKTKEHTNSVLSYEEQIQERKGAVYSKLSEGDVFYRLFLGDSCLGKACYSNCKYKYDQSAADIRIGDLWGKTYKNNEDGVSGVVTFTEKGESLIHECNLEIHPHPFEIIAEGQMKKNAQKPLFYNINFIIIEYLPIPLKLRYTIIHLITRIGNKLIRLFKQ